MRLNKFFCKDIWNIDGYSIKCLFGQDKELKRVAFAVLQSKDTLLGEFLETKKPIMFRLL